MNIDNVVLVRAMSYIPLNGELIPSCEAKTLRPDKQLEFTHYIKRKIYKEIVEHVEQPLTVTEKEQLTDKIMEKYKVLIPEHYTSTLSFALNGMVPDDMHNCFSNMPVAVIDPLKNHLDADFVNIDAIDTTTKGRMSVSQDAIMVINEQVFNSLDLETKENLMANYKIETFNGSIREAVDSTLKKYCYPSLPLVQDIPNKNIGECEERDSLIEFENTFAQSIGASRLSLQTLYNDPTITAGVDGKAREKVAGDFPLANEVYDYHKKQLYNFMIMKAESLNINLSDAEKYYLFTRFQEGQDALEHITDELINAYGGINGFQEFIAEYNNYAIANLITPAEIIALNNEARNR